MSTRLIFDRALWDSFINESTSSTIYHRWDFLKILEKYTRYKLLPYGIYKGQDLICVIPLFYHVDLGLKLLYSPPPTSIVYIPYLGFATGPAVDGLKHHEKEECWNFIAEELANIVKSISPNYMSLSLAPGTKDVRPFTWNDFEADLRYTYTIDLERPLDKIWESLESDCKKSIRITSKYPLTLKRGDDANALIGLMRVGLQKAGKTFYHRQGPEYLKDVLEAFPDHIRMYFLYNGDALIGGSVNCVFNGRCVGWMGATTSTNGLTANEYMIWEILKMAKSEGYKMFENIGADEKRLNHAKTKFNPTLVPCFYIYKKDMLYKTAKYSMTRLEEAIGRKGAMA
jgi:Acetyltransferase (GNAT) domain